MLSRSLLACAEPHRNLSSEYRKSSCVHRCKQVGKVSNGQKEQMGHDTEVLSRSMWGLLSGDLSQFFFPAAREHAAVGFLKA